MHKDCLKIREYILNAAGQSGHGHIPTCFSVVEMLYSLYSHIRHQPQDPQWSERDLFVLSKGHAALGLYATLAHFGYFSPDELQSFGAFRSRLGCHPDRTKVPGVEASTGSLGHGIGIAAGMALALKIQKSSRQVYTLIGDGEANEGSVWEALMVATDQKLNQLTVLYDNNRSQVRCLQIPNPAVRLRSFGCSVIEVDGHDLSALSEALHAPSEQVKAIVCNTVKGHGCKSISDDMFAWHRRSPNPNELEQLLEELHASAV